MEKRRSLAKTSKKRASKVAHEMPATVDPEEPFLADTEAISNEVEDDLIVNPEVVEPPAFEEPPPGEGP